MSIPKIIHQIAPADRDKWHLFWHKCHDSWKQNFPDYTFKLWNDKEDIDNFVKENYPQFWNVYNAFPFHIMKIDFVRLCILHKYGGIYADMDIFCYKNFSDFMTKDIYFLENLIPEYTDARYENSMMASAPSHRLLEELMKYSKTCFIHFRNKFNSKDHHWRNPENDKCINNSTGSGMISKGIETLQAYFDVGAFDCKLFNNRPGSYDEVFFTKHVHTSVWGNEYLEYYDSNNTNKANILDSLLIINGSLYSVSSNILAKDIEKIKADGATVSLITNLDFNFFYDYTENNYLTGSNLEQIKSKVQRH